ncbi:hypothetical protein GOODEAATRI_006179 [Goodea atripinnis]|uniref:Uncharacterized protein n=1 Tax=Goodea atripinnis TaxID=208336 RepID=A0ABV0N8C1_9TELE
MALGLFHMLSCYNHKLQLTSLLGFCVINQHTTVYNCEIKRERYSVLKMYRYIRDLTGIFFGLHEAISSRMFYNEALSPFTEAPDVTLNSATRWQPHALDTLFFSRDREPSEAFLEKTMHITPNTQSPHRNMVVAASCCGDNVLQQWKRVRVDGQMDGRKYSVFIKENLLEAKTFF